MSNLPLTERPEGATLFSQARSADAWVRAHTNGLKVVELRSRGTPSTAVMYGVGNTHSLGRRSISLVPFGLYANPSHHDGLRESVQDVIAVLEGLRGEDSIAELCRRYILRNFAFFFLPLALAAFVRGLPYGVVGVAAVYFFATLLSLIPAFYLVLREVDLSVKDLIANLWRPISIALVTAIFLIEADIWVVPPHIQPWLRLAILASTGTSFYVVSLPLLAPDLLRELKGFWWQRS